MHIITFSQSSQSITGLEVAYRVIVCSCTLKIFLKSSQNLSWLLLRYVSMFSHQITNFGPNTSLNSGFNVFLTYSPYFRITEHLIDRVMHIHRILDHSSIFKHLDLFRHPSYGKIITVAVKLYTEIHKQEINQNRQFLK